MAYIYKNKGTCSVQTEVELNPDHTIKSVKVLGGCDGNLKGIASLLPGMKAEDAITRMEGIRCGRKATSCPDQIEPGPERRLGRVRLKRSQPMDCFHYPLDTETLLRKKRRLRRELLAQNPHPLRKKIAILGGSTTNEVADQLGLFLLQYGIEAEFYQSEYAQYWQDAMFGTPELDEFHPDIIYIHTSWRNLTALPTTADSEADIDAMLADQYTHFETMWQALEAKFGCPVIQNNFDRPNFRLMGNRDIWDPHGRSNFISRMNQKFDAYAAAHEHFYINDIRLPLRRLRPDRLGRRLLLAHVQICHVSGCHPVAGQQCGQYHQVFVRP